MGFIVWPFLWTQARLTVSGADVRIDGPAPERTACAVANAGVHAVARAGLGGYRGNLPQGQSRPIAGRLPSASHFREWRQQNLRLHSAIGQACIRPAGKTILRVQTARNVFRRLNPEFIEFDLAPDAIEPASLDDLQAEVASTRRCCSSRSRSWWVTPDGMTPL